MASAQGQNSHSPMDNGPGFLSPPFGSQVSIPLPGTPHSTLPLTTQRRRRSSKGSITSTKLKRSASTPNVRGLGITDAGMSLADKRRNKLGYHRTSVACGHCRRRKIRCLLAPDDAQNRCSNCIRLKKECNFFPVDQQPQIERRPRTASKAEARSGDASASSSSSPALGAGQNVEQVDNYNHYPPLPLPSQDFSASSSMSANPLSPARRASINSRAYEFPNHHERQHWDSPFFDHGPVSTGQSTPEDASQAYWKLAESPMTPVFPSQFQGPPSSTAHHPRESVGSFTTFAPPREDHGWPILTRSMSFGGYVEDVAGNYPNHYHHGFQMDFRRRASEMNPPSLVTSSNSSNTSIPEAHVAPHSAPVSSQPLHHFVSPGWNHLPGHSHVGKAPDYSAWYSEPAILAQVQEEEVAPPFGGDPAILYSSPGLH